MPKTMGASSGDGVIDPFVSAELTLPDAGSSIVIEGSIKPIGAAEIAITGSPLTAPSPPGSGLIYWIIQVNTSTGAASIKQSTSSYPAPDASNVSMFNETLAPTDTNLAADTSSDMLNQW